MLFLLPRSFCSFIDRAGVVHISLSNIKGRMDDEPIYQGYVYVLRLQDHCWYVGYSVSPEVRIASHFMGRGAQWTRLHPPVAVESLQPGDEKLENVVTIATMVKHGYKRVRGGRYLEACMPCAPPPILKAFALRPPPPLPDDVEIEAMGGHGVVLTKLQEGPRAWRARVSGDKALKQCPSKGFKTLYAPTEAEIREVVARWLEDARSISPNVV